MARKMIAKRVYITDGGKEKRSADPTAKALEFRWMDKDAGEASRFDMSELPDHIVRALAYHGLSQKLGDAFADADGDTEYARDAVAAVWAMLKDGDWSRRAEGNGGSAARPTILAAALAEVTGRDIADVVESLESKTKEEVAGYKKHPAVAAAMARIKAERAEERRKAMEAEAQDAPEIKL